MNWQQLDVPTRAGFLAGAVALLGLLVPPLSMTSAVVAIGFSGIGWRRSQRRGEANPVAKSVLLASVGLIVLVTVGSAIYAAGG